MKSIVVADAGPLHYLIQIHCADVLEKLFERVLVPMAVRNELQHPSAPLSVRNWIRQERNWLKIEPVLSPIAIEGLHQGEAEALQLAAQEKINGILMDDLDGREMARQRGLIVIGTVGILERAAEMELIELPATVEKLKQTNFYISPKLLEAALVRDRNRQSKQ